MKLTLENFALNQLQDETIFIKSRGLDVWITRKPKTIYLKLTAEVEQGQDLIELECSESFTLYRNDVIRFENNNEKVVVKQTKDLFAGTVNTVSIYQSKYLIPVESESISYAMTPFLSVKEGSLPQVSVSYAEAHNKNMGLYAVSQKIKEDATATIMGTLNKKDSAMPILQDIKEGLNKIFVQVRHSPLVDINTVKYGEGAGAIEYWAIPQVSMTDNESEFINFQLELKLLHQPRSYAIPTGKVYVPVPVPVVPEESSASYCPLDAIDYYEIELSCYYCPLDTTGFYDFAQSP